MAARITQRIVAAQEGSRIMTVPPKTVQVAITLEDEIPIVGPAEAAPGDTVIWQAGDDTVSIWFPNAGVFQSRELCCRGTGDIEMVVPESAVEGTYRYAVFSHDKGDFAQGGSHPVMIIRKP